MPKPDDLPPLLWYEHDYSGEVRGEYRRTFVRVLHVEGPLTQPLREPYPEALPGSMQDIPIDQSKATFTIEMLWPESGRRVVPFREVSFPR